MSGSVELGEALVRRLDALEAQTPGAFYSVSALRAFMSGENIELPIDLSMESFLKQLVEWDWLEAGGDGDAFEFMDCSFRITAKGQYRATASVDFAAQYQKMVDDAPMAPDSPTEIVDDKLAADHHFTIPNSSTGVPTGEKPTLAIVQHIGLEQKQPVDSQKWTGSQFVLIDRALIVQVNACATELQEAVYAMRFESNSESQNLKGLADALVAICSMAEPEVNLIERILANPKFKTYASLFAIVATIRGAIGF
jgi:hypothetical protein